MRKLLWFLPLCFGFVIGFAAPTESATSRTYTASILPASGSSGQSPYLTCGWHGGACGSGSGNYLDWDNTSTSSVYFRGIFKRSDASSESGRLKGFQIKVSNGSDRCDIQDVAIIHPASSTILGYMRFTHISTNATGYFSLTTSGSGIYNSRTIGSMVVDSGCPWAGTHVHAGYRTDKGVASRSRNTSRFSSDDYCDPSRGTCKNYTNNSSTNWTHRFTWSGS